MEKKKRGFTLIELLAVILILGIIALIAIPTVKKIIDQSRKGAFETTTNNVVSAIEDACRLQLLKGELLTATYTFTNGQVSPSLNIKGDLPKNGTATVDGNCNVTLNVTNGKYTAIKSPIEDAVTIVDGGEAPIGNTVYANGTAVYFNPETGTTCNIGDAVSLTGTKTGCMKWYAFNDNSTNDTVNLILDHNTTAAVIWNSSSDNTSGPNEIMPQLASDTSLWLGVPTRTDSYSLNNGTANYTINYNTYKARLITAQEIATISGNSSFVESTNPYSSWFYIDSNNQTQTATTIGASNYSWLYDYTYDCTNSGCNIADASTQGYWTSTAAFNSTLRTWLMDFYGDFSNYNVGDNHSYGVRPVITISKSQL